MTQGTVTRTHGELESLARNPTGTGTSRGGTAGPGPAAARIWNPDTLDENSIGTTRYILVLVCTSMNVSYQNIPVYTSIY